MVQYLNKLRPIIVRVFSALALSVSFAQTLAAEPAIDVYPVITLEASAETVKLGDLARISGIKDAAEKKAIEDVALQLPINFSLPRQYLDGFAAKRIIADTLLQNKLSRYQVAGPNRVLVRIKRKLEVDNKAAVIAADYLLSLLERKYSGIQLSVIGQPQEPPADGAELKPRHISEAVSKRMVVWIDSYIDQQVVASIPVWFDVEAHAAALTLKRNVLKNQKITGKDFIKKDVDVTNLQGEALFNEEETADLWYKSDLQEGQILYKALTKKHFAVSYGDTVEVISVAGTVQIQATAVAQGDANLGETVKAMSPGSKEIFSGQVAGPNLIIVDSSQQQK